MRSSVYPALAALCLLGIFLIPACSADNYQYPDYGKNPDPVLNNDDAKYNDFVTNLPDGNYVICVYANDPWVGVGHGFIKIWWPDGTNRIGYGFYPADEDHKTSGPGEMGNKDNGHEWQYKHCQQVNRSTVIHVFNVTRAWRNNWYNLFTQNCCHYVNDVMNVTGSSITASSYSGTRPGNLGSNIKSVPGYVENTNEDQTAEMVWDPATGKWIPEPAKRADRRKTRPIAVPTPIGTPAADIAPVTGGTVIGSLIESPDDIQNLIDRQFASVPADIQDMAADSRILIVIDDYPAPPAGVAGAGNTLALTFAGTELSAVDPTVAAPDYKVYIKNGVFNELFVAGDPVATYRTALGRGDIRIESADAGEGLVLAGAGMVNKAALILTPPPYLIAVGQERDVFMNGKPYQLSRPKNIILLQEAGMPYTTVINSNGATQGYTSPGTTRAISVSRKYHTPVSGVYRTTPYELQQRAAEMFNIPAGFPQGTASDPSQYMLAGGGGNALLVAGGAGFAAGYGR